MFPGRRRLNKRWRWQTIGFKDDKYWSLEHTKKGMKWIKRRGFSRKAINIKTPKFIELLAEKYPRGLSPISFGTLKLKRFNEVSTRSV